MRENKSQAHPRSANEHNRPIRKLPAETELWSLAISSEIVQIPKLQAPSTKLQRNSKHQISKPARAPFWSLKFGSSLVLGASSFVLLVRPYSIDFVDEPALFQGCALSWMNSSGRRRRFGQVADAQSEGGLTCEDSRARINYDATHGGQIALRVHHIHIGAKAMLVGFERGGKGAFRSGDKFCRGLLFAKRGFEISPGLPDFPDNRIA